MLALEITSRPLEWEFEVTPAQLKMKQSDNPSMTMDRVPPALSIERSKNIEVRLDSTELRKSLNLKPINDFIYDAGQRGRDSVPVTLDETVQFGNQMAKIEDGVTIGQIVQQKLMEQPDTYTFFLPSAPYDISWEANELDMDYERGSIEYDWQIAKNVMDYVPGSFSINILQRPEVDIKYVGKPIYVPPSSAPDYEAEI